MYVVFERDLQLTIISHLKNKTTGTSQHHQQDERREQNCGCGTSLGLAARADQRTRGGSAVESTTCDHAVHSFGRKRARCEIFDQKLGSLCIEWLEDPVFAIRSAATENLSRIAKLFGHNGHRVVSYPRF